MKEFTPKDIFGTVAKSEAKEVRINLEEKTITAENKLDLYKLLSSFGLVAFTENGNYVRILDKDRVLVLSTVSEKVKFKNSFDQTSPNYFYPVTATIGDKDRWTIRGSVSKARPTE